MSSGQRTVVRPTILPHSLWGGELPSGTFRSQTPCHIAIIEERVRHKDSSEDTSYLVKQQTKATKELAWGEVPWHFYIDADGNIYEGRAQESQSPRLQERLEPDGWLFISFLNDFCVMPPSEKEIDSLIQLSCWLCEKYKIPGDQVHSGREVQESLAPGKLLQGYFDQGIIQGRVEAILAQLTPPPTPRTSRYE